MRVATAIAVGLLLSAPSLAPAQQQTTPGPISRIILVRIKPGQGEAFWNDIRRNLKPVYEEYKKQGVIVDYGFFTKSTSESPEDWNVGLSLTYANWAAFDNLNQRTEPVTLKHYGTADARTKAGMAREAYREVIQSFLIRAQDPLPAPR